MGKTYDSLTNAEEELMKAVWKTGKSMVNRNEVMNHLGNGKDWKATTVLTIFSKLVEKRYLKMKKQGKENIYTILVNESDYLKKETRSFLERLHRGSLKNLIATLYDDQAITREELDKLANWFKNQGV